VIYQRPFIITSFINVLFYLRLKVIDVKFTTIEKISVIEREILREVQRQIKYLLCWSFWSAHHGSCIPCIPISLWSRYLSQGFCTSNQICRDYARLRQRLLYVVREVHLMHDVSLMNVHRIIAAIFDYRSVAVGSRVNMPSELFLQRCFKSKQFTLRTPARKKNIAVCVL